MNDDMNDSPHEASARRRLIRGAFSVPAVLTLHSGGAVAATSVLCSAKIPQTATVVTDADDVYLRYRLWGWVKNNTREVKSYYIQGSDFLSIGFPAKVDAKFQPKSGQWQLFDLSGGAPTGSFMAQKPGSSTTSQPPASNSYTFKQVDKWVVLRVDSQGYVVGIGGGGNGVLASDSCVTSLVGAAVLKG